MPIESIPMGNGFVDWSQNIKPMIQSWIDVNKYKQQRDDDLKKVLLTAAVQNKFLTPDVGTNGIEVAGMNWKTNPMATSPAITIPGVGSFGADDLHKYYQAMAEQYKLEQDMALDAEMAEKEARGEIAKDPFFSTIKKGSSSLAYKELKKKGKTTANPRKEAIAALQAANIEPSEANIQYYLQKMGR
jgi:hypothetical protein